MRGHKFTHARYILTPFWNHISVDERTVSISHAPHNDVSVNDGPHVRRWSHIIIIQCVTPVTEPGWLPDLCSVSQQLGARQTRTIDTHYRHTLQTRTTDTHYRHTLQTRTTDTHYRHALQTHYRHTLQTRTTDTHYTHALHPRTTGTHYRHALQTHTTDTHYRHTQQTHTTDTFLFISHTTNVILFKFRCNIFIGVRIIKEMPGSVASGTTCITEAERVYSAVRTESLYKADTCRYTKLSDWFCTVCPTRYRTRLAGGPLLRDATIRRTTDTHYRHALQTRTTDTLLFISHTTNVLLFKFRCNIFIGVRIITEMPGSVASETSCIIL